jgi:hypothetical protein
MPEAFSRAMLEKRAVRSIDRYGTLELVTGVSGDEAEGLTLIRHARDTASKRGK